MKTVLRFFQVALILLAIGGVFQMFYHRSLFPLIFVAGAVMIHRCIAQEIKTR